MNFWEIIILFFGFQAILLGILFLGKRDQELQANRLLAFLLLAFGYCICYNSLFWSRLLYSPNFIHLTTTYLIPQALLGPIFFLYIRTVVTRKKLSWKRDVWHGIPAFLIFLQFLPYYLLSAEDKQIRLSHGGGSGGFSLPYGDVMLVIGMAAYVVVAYTRYVRSFAEDEELKIWLRLICWAFGACVGAYLIYYLLAYAGILTTEQDYAITLAMVVCVGMTAYFGFYQPELFNGRPLRTIVPFVKYQKTRLSDSTAKELEDKLADLMATQQLYLKSDLRLDDISRALGVSRHLVSQVINSTYQVNFFDFINRYRIMSAQKMIRENPGHLSYKSIAYAVGFNTYVSFYKAFRKHAGCSPSSYQEKMAADLSS